MASFAKLQLMLLPKQRRSTISDKIKVLGYPLWTVYVYYGSENIFYLGPKIWEAVPVKIQFSEQFQIGSYK